MSICYREFGKYRKEVGDDARSTRPRRRGPPRRARSLGPFAAHVGVCRLLSRCETGTVVPQLTFSFTNTGARSPIR